ncbi:sterol-binding protein [Geobacillus sp. 44B]|nr:sterol-binding protein [Geobacillus sp. 44B]
MNMRELVSQLAERMQTLNHLLPILPEEELYVRFECETETAVVAISKHQISPKAEVDERRVLTVRGSKEVLESLLSGRMKLQQQIRLKEVCISGSFRHMLLLESLLHLAKPYRYVC